jgi:hypothetical protein
MHEGIRPPKFHEPKVAAAVPQADLPKRPNRKPFGSMQLKLAHEIKQGFHGHWFNDTPGRIDRAAEAGYEHVKDKDGKNVSRVVGTAEGGGALTAFLMMIPEEWYQEDIKKEQDHIAEKEDLMRGGKLEAPEGGYVPSQGISIRQGT